MLKNIVTSRLIIGVWLAVIATIVVVSRAMDASLSTSALLFGLGVAPGVVTALLARGEAPPTVAEILYAAGAKGGRS
ncbi:MAG TPA: hypothetical protein VFA59_23545 [Vicinamibacterales bacterium]|nr:hypothetical protein [Vicinamibacterales bacterium]